MRRLISRASALMVLLAFTSQSPAAVILNESFDSYADQAALNVAWPTIGTAAIVLNTEQAVSPTQSVKGLTTATRSARSVGEVGFLNATSDVVIFRFQFFDSNGAAAAYRQYAELLDGAGTSAGQLYAIGLNNNIASTKYMARILGADGGTGVSTFFQLNDAGSPNRSTGWHTLEAQISDVDVKYYVDGTLSKTVNIAALTDRSFDIARVGSNLTATQVAYFDDVYIERTVIPEPGSLLSIGLVALAALRRRRA